MLPLDAGNKRYIRFADAGGEKEAWRIDTPGYPHEVAAWRNLVLWAYSYLSKDGILYAYRAGEREPAWTVDVNKIVTRRPRPLTSLYFHVIEDTIYLQVEEHMLAIKPESGVVLWHRNLAADLGLQFAPDFYRRGISYAGVAKDGDILVVTYENRIIALDVRRGKYLWHMMPDTFPERALPIAHEGRLYFTAGARRKMIQVANAGERNHRQQRVRPRQQASP
jgi:outer membrane protein assembly factor BamB